MVDYITLGIGAGIVTGIAYLGYTYLIDTEDDDGLELQRIETVVDDNVKDLVQQLGSPVSSTFLRRGGVNLGRVSDVARLSQPVDPERAEQLGAEDYQAEDDDVNLYGFITGPTGWLSYAVLTRIPFLDAKDSHLISKDNLEDPADTRHFEVSESAHVSKKAGGVYTDSSVESQAAVDEVFSKRREEALLAGMEQFTSNAVRLDAGTSSRIKEELEKLKAEHQGWQNRSDEKV